MEIENSHISLSRTFAVRSHQITPFINKLGTEISKNMTSHALNNISKCIELSSATYTLQNDKGTREFVCLPVERDYGDTLPSLVQACDAALSAFKKEKYYDNPQFHVSIASYIPSTKATNAASNDCKDSEVVGVEYTPCPDSDEDFENESNSKECDTAPSTTSNISEQQGMILSLELDEVQCCLGNRTFTMKLSQLRHGFVEQKRWMELK